MIILAVDTTSKSGGVALAKDETLLGELVFNTGETHSKHLMAMIDHLLQMTGITAKDINGLAVSAGPGSFTGLRIGISVVKGLAAALGIPVCGVSSLLTLAGQAAYASIPICPMMDARRKEIYTSLYMPLAGTLTEMMPEKAESPKNALIRVMERHHGSVLFIGDGAVLYKDVIVSHMQDAACFAPFELNLIRPGTIARIAFSHFESGDTEKGDLLKPVYIRSSDAKLPKNILI